MTLAFLTDPDHIVAARYGRDMIAKTVRWLFFSVFFSLVPILADYGWAFGNSAVDVPNLSAVLRHGELYLLSSALAAIGLGEVIGVNQNWQIPKIITGGISILNICFATFLYTYINNSGAERAAIYWSSKSLLFFAFSCIVATSCVALSEIGDA